MALVACKECGKELSSKAASCPHCGLPCGQRPDPEKSKKAASSAASALGCLGLLLVLGLVKLAGSSSEESTKPARPSASTDSEVEAFMRGNVLSARKGLPVAASEEAFDAWVKSGQANDSLGLTEMLAAGHLAMLPARCKVRVLDRSVWHGWVQLRVESGDLLGASVYAVANEADFDWAATRRRPEEVGDAKPQSRSTRVAAPADSATEPTASNYSVGVEAVALDSSKVRIKATTSIPGTVEVAVGLAWSGQDPEETFIGIWGEHLTLRDGKGEIELDTSTLPTGQYDAEVNFYPGWGLVDERSKKSGANTELEARAPIAIQGSGQKAEDAKEMLAGQKWVMENVNMGRKWDPNEWSRFGAAESVTPTRHNPKVIKGYYYPAIDMTVFVNALKGEITVWRLGKETD